MSDSDKQSLLFITIEHLKFQYECSQSPLIALSISKHYGLLSYSNLTQNQQEKYAIASKLWLTRYIKNQRHSEKMQHSLHDFIQFHEFTFNTL